MDLAQDLGVSYDVVKKWHQRGSIPSSYWSRLIRFAIKRDINGVTWEVLDELRGRKSVSSADETQYLAEGQL